jgi:hypothetical protein
VVVLEEFRSEMLEGSLHSFADIGHSLLEQTEVLIHWWALLLGVL